MIGLTS